MNIDIETIVTSTITFVILLILKFLLDMKLAQFIVKYFSILPVRTYFRNKPISIAGKWEQNRESGESENFKLNTERHGYTDIKQLGNYCYGEYIAKGTTYIIFGRIIDNYFVGDWYNKKDSLGYFGAFQLDIIDSNTMKGVWIGHSKTEKKVRSDIWEWKKITQ